MKGIKFRRFVSVIAFLLLFAVLYQKVEWMLNLKNGSSRVHNFYHEQEEESLDVIFMGSSHSYYGIHPMDFWRDYGVPSYVLGSPLQNAGTTYYLLKDALERQSPKVVVLEGYNLFTDKKVSNHRMFQQTMDGMPLSLNKIRMGEDLLGDEMDFSQRLPYYFTIIQYHSRWTELREKDFVPDSVTKGSKPAFGIEVLPEAPKVTETEPIPEVVKGYVDKIIELCEEKGTSLMVCMTPFTGEKGDEEWYISRQRVLNGVEDYLEEREIPCINYAHLTEEIGFDFEQDLKDKGHLNMSGSRKVNRHLFDYLMSHYDLKDRRNEKEYQSWNEDLTAYEQKLVEGKAKAERGEEADENAPGEQD